MRVPRWLYDPDRVPTRADIWQSLGIALVAALAVGVFLATDMPTYLAVAALAGVANGLLTAGRLIRAGAWHGLYSSNRTADPATMTHWRG